MGSLDWKGAQPPRSEVLGGAAARLEPVDPARHAAGLFQSSSGADSIWDYLAYGPFVDLATFTAWLHERAASSDPLFFTVVDIDADAPRGMASYMRMDPPNGVIEIGHIWFAPALQRTPTATEAIFLLARHAFDDLGYRRLEWKCDSQNARSRRAAERFGFVYEGVFRQHMVTKGRNRDTAWFAMTDGDWPLRKSSFETWLARSNFDENGRQRRSLAEIRTALDT